MTISDSDTPANQLIYRTNQTNFGHFEYVTKPGVPITDFSVNDVEKERVIYVDHSNASNNSYITFRLFDGIAESTFVKLPIQTFPQMWRLQNNTGLLLMHEASAFITTYNLSFISNVNHTDNADYHILRAPKYGVVEVEKNGVWEKAIKFTSAEMRKHKVRYKHLSSTPTHDEFQVSFIYY